MEPGFDIRFLDHVAITVEDMEASAAWYSKCLGLKQYEVPEWGGAPIFLLAGKTGIALFPARNGGDDTSGGYKSNSVRIDHYAFNVSREDFKKAQTHYDDLGLQYEVKDHIYFHSIYTKDPDGHTVELTTLMVDEAEFYGQSD